MTDNPFNELGPFSIPCERCEFRTLACADIALAKQDFLDHLKQRHPEDVQAFLAAIDAPELDDDLQP